METIKLKELFSKLTSLFEDFKQVSTDNGILYYDAEELVDGVALYSAVGGKFGPASDGEYVSDELKFEVKEGMFVTFNPGGAIPAPEDENNVSTIGDASVSIDNGDPSVITDAAGATLQSTVDIDPNNPIPGAVDAVAPEGVVPDVEPVETAEGDPMPKNKAVDINGVLEQLVSSLQSQLMPAVQEAISPMISQAIEQSLAPILERVGNLEGLANCAPQATELKQFSSEAPKNKYERINDFWSAVGKF